MIVRLLILNDVFIFLVICDFFFAVLYLFVDFWQFVVLLCPSVFILWLFFKIICVFGMLFSARGDVLFVVILCLCDHLCVFGRCVFLLVRYYVCKDTPPPP